MEQERHDNTIAPYLTRATEVLTGESSHRAIARVLGPLHPDGPRDTIDPRMVRRWMAGQRDIPSWVPEVLADALRCGASEMLDAAASLDRGNPGAKL